MSKTNEKMSEADVMAVIQKMRDAVEPRSSPEAAALKDNPRAIAMKGSGLDDPAVRQALDSVPAIGVILLEEYSEFSYDKLHDVVTNVFGNRPNGSVFLLAPVDENGVFPFFVRQLATMLVMTGDIVRFGWSDGAYEIPKGYKMLGGIEALTLCGPIIGTVVTRQEAEEFWGVTQAALKHRPSLDGGLALMFLSITGVPSAIRLGLDSVESTIMYGLERRLFTGSGVVLTIVGMDGRMAQCGDDIDPAIIRAFVEAGGLTSLAWVNPQGSEQPYIQQGLTFDMYNVAKAYLGAADDSDAGRGALVQRCAELEAKYRRVAYRLLATSKDRALQAIPSTPVMLNVLAATPGPLAYRTPRERERCFVSTWGRRDALDDLSPVSFLRDCRVMRGGDETMGDIETGIAAEAVLPNGAIDFVKMSNAAVRAFMAGPSADVA